MDYNVTQNLHVFGHWINNIQPVVNVSIHAKDAQTKQTMVANWQFNYEPTGSSATVPAIGSGGASPSTGQPTR